MSIIDPCGTPEITDVQSDFTPLIWIDCFLSLIKDVSQDIMGSEKLYILNLCINNLCETESNAF